MFGKLIEDQAKWSVSLNTSDIDSFSDLSRIVEKSSIGNKAVIFDEIFHWQDWKSFLADEFSLIQSIKNYHFFRFRTIYIRAVFLKEISADDERLLTLCGKPRR